MTALIQFFSFIDCTLTISFTNKKCLQFETGHLMIKYFIIHFHYCCDNWWLLLW